ncbi:hypothetical protein IMZ48_40955 [Candidatus Bathyarchaeota archaeon]|nr:hypothetical protein [Candidatus Bathyarchaeota archaeon]
MAGAASRAEAVLVALVAHLGGHMERLVAGNTLAAQDVVTGVARDLGHITAELSRDDERILDRSGARPH